LARPGNWSSHARPLPQYTHSGLEHVYLGIHNRVCHSAGTDDVTAGNPTGDGRPREQHLHLPAVGCASARPLAFRPLGADLGHAVVVPGQRRRLGNHCRRWISNDSRPSCRSIPGPSLNSFSSKSKKTGWGEPSNFSQWYTSKTQRLLANGYVLIT